ncbi:hypothetical protein N656DRAFT_410031 [Canariomyces notabilis]|uniref:Uncharacterized protein n=1 Tax=Canariomyces notabilis TaxID=2074819 RepID=A0AAN6YW48_9PEZI|nr:hypothetical protein N656DRAFT_410031 [Canariomyces arenarius]
MQDTRTLISPPIVTYHPGGTWPLYHDHDHAATAGAGVEAVEGPWPRLSAWLRQVQMRHRNSHLSATANTNSYRLPSASTHASSSHTSEISSSLSWMAPAVRKNHTGSGISQPIVATPLGYPGLGAVQTRQQQGEQQQGQGIGVAVSTKEHGVTSPNEGFDGSSLVSLPTPPPAVRISGFGAWSPDGGFQASVASTSRGSFG